MLRKLKRFIASIDLVKLMMVPIAGAFIAVSSLFSFYFAYSVGEPSGFEMVFVLFGLAVDGYAALALPALWPRLVFAGRILLVAFLLPCLAYKLTAAHRFAVENLTKREASRAEAAASYERATQRVEVLRARLTETASARPAGVVQAQIDSLLRDPNTEGCTGAWNGPTTREVCPKVDKLRVELAAAQSFAQTQSALTDALKALNGREPVRMVSEAATGPIPWLLGQLGYAPHSFASFISVLMMILVEAGSVAVPALVGFARRSGAQAALIAHKEAPARLAPEGEPEAPKSASRDLTDAARNGVAELTRFLAERTERAMGEKVQSTALYAAYTGWKECKGERPMSINQFGTVLTQHLGLTKEKRGVRSYLNMRLKAPQTSARHLQAVGRRAS